MSDYEIRTVTVDDAEHLLAIYSYYVENTAITFEYATPTLAEFKDRIFNTLKKYPYLCILKEGTILGYAYAGPFHTRAAYQWTAELTIYLAPDARKCGLGRMLYDTLESQLKEMGILNLYACIGYPRTEDEYGAGEGVEKRGLAAVGIARQGNFEFHGILSFQSLALANSLTKNYSTSIISASALRTLSS